jgi:hypothetical protein
METKNIGGKNMKKFILGLLVGITVTMSTSVFADSTLSKIEAYVNPSISIVIDGKKAELHNAPINYDGSTYLPLRETATLFGKDVTWNEESQTIELGDFKAKVGEDNMEIAKFNGKDYVSVFSVANTYRAQGYMFDFNSKKKVFVLKFNNDPTGNTAKNVVLLDNIKYTVINDTAYFDYEFFKTAILPRLK